MNISPYHVQNVIRAYGQRISRRNLLNVKTDPNRYSLDIVNISEEAKGRQITEKVATEIISRAKGVKADPRLGAHLIERLGEELGGRLSGLKEEEKGFKFIVVDSSGGEVVKELSAKDTEQLILSVYDRIERKYSEGDKAVRSEP